MASGGGGSPKKPSAHSSSSDADVNAVRDGLANLSMTGGEDFKRLLECPICMEILDSPIYQCQRGHTICNTCKPKLTKCPSCEAPVGATRNLALESILQTLSFSCNNHLKGCNKALQIQDLQKHHEECELRPLKCHLSDKDNCNGTLLYLADTLKHLQETHNLKTVNSMKGHPNIFKSGNRMCFRVPVTTAEWNYSCPLTWPCESFYFDENVFVALMRNGSGAKSDFTFFGFYLIGSKSDASKYSVKITIQKSALALPEGAGVWRHEVTTRFTSIRSFQEKWKENKHPEEVVVYTAGMDRDTIIAEKGTNHTLPAWDIIYEINKL